MIMKKKEKEKELKKCNCDETCDCGCKEGKECTCENCNCENCECENDKECTCEDCKCESCTCEDELNQKIAELTDRLQRTQAEMINFKKRKEDETSLMLRYCNEDLLLKLVGVVDNFERALSMEDISEEAIKYRDGFKIMYTNMLEILKSYEVTEIEVFGKPFDPKVSEALLVQHSDEYDSGVVIEVLQKGYMYKDKILRPAMVKINN